MNKRLPFFGILLLTALSGPALAQTTPAPLSEKDIYTFVEQMPAMAEGGEAAAVSMALQRLVRYPPKAIQDGAEGRVFVSFVVTATGQVVQPQIVKGVRADLDSAVLAAVAQMPRLVPGRQNGKPVAVRLTAPLSFRLQAPAAATPPTRPAAGAPDLQLQDPASPERMSGKTYTYVEQMPQLPGGGGNKAIVEAVERNLKYPQEALRNRVEGRVFVSFTVTTEGLVQDVKIVKGIGFGCDEAVLAAVKQLPRMKPGTQQGQPVEVSFTVPINFKLAAPLPAPLPAPGRSQFGPRDPWR